MLKKLNIGLKWFILIIFIISIIYFIISSIVDIISNNINKDKNKIDISNINNYLYEDNNTAEKKIDSKKLVRNYNEFYTLQNIIQRFVDKLISKEFSDTYSVLSEEMKEKYNKKEYIKDIELLANNNFIISDSDHNYININRLKNAYKISDNCYICEYSCIDDKIIKFGIRLYPKTKQYEVFYIEM